MICWLLDNKKCENKFLHIVGLVNRNVSETESSGNDRRKAENLSDFPILHDEPICDCNLFYEKEEFFYTQKIFFLIVKLTPQLSKTYFNQFIVC